MNTTITRTAAAILSGLSLAAAAGDPGASDVAKNLDFRSATRIEVKEQRQAYVWHQKMEIQNSGANALKLVGLTYTVEIKDPKTGKVSEFGVGGKAELEIAAPEAGETSHVTAGEFEVTLGAVGDPATIGRLLKLINLTGDPETHPDIILKGQAAVWLGINGKAGCWVEGPVAHFVWTVRPQFPNQIAMN